MGYDVNEDTIFVKNLVFDGCQEVPVDLDFSLPDYCPDIQKILKCSVCPKISSRNISGDRLNIEGNIDVKIIYMDSDKKSVRCCENTTPFSCSVDLRVSPENAVSVISNRVEYMNCRAVSPRKIDIHGALAICVKVYNKDNKNVTCNIEGKDIEQRKRKIAFSDLEGIGQQQFSINEVLDLGQNKPAPEIIVRSDVSLFLEEIKNMLNKVMLKGKAIVKILYIGDISSGQLEVMEYSVPFNQIIDVLGAKEESKCSVFLEVLGHEEQIQAEEQGDSNLITEDIRAAATVMAYTAKEVEIVKDVYSTEYNLECKNEIAKFYKFYDSIKESESINSAIEFTEFKISEVVDIWSDNSQIKGKYEDGKLMFEGKMNICILAIDLEQTPFYIERIIDFEYKKELSLIEEAVVESKLSPLAIGYRIAGSNCIEIKADVDISADVYTCEKCNMVVEAEATQTQPIDKDKNAALTIYFASAGESIWDIARKYYTSCDLIKEENEISEEVLEQERMLLIPMNSQ